MGISVSSTITNQRLIQKRSIRKLKKYQQNDSVNYKLVPINLTNKNQMKQFPIIQNQQTTQIKNLENFQINLKTHIQKHGDQNKLSTQRNNCKQTLIKKQNINASPMMEDKQPLTITHNNQKNQNVQGQSLLQQIDLTPNKNLMIQIKIDPSQKVNQFNISNTNKNITTSQKILSKFDGITLKEHQNQQIQKQKIKKKVQQAKKYIQESSYPKSQLSNNTYQHTSNKKIQGINLNKSNSLEIPVKKVDQNQSFQGATIKLKTQQECIDDVKHPDTLVHYKQVGSNRKSSKNNAISLNLLNKKS